MAQLNYNNFIRWYTNAVNDETVNIPRFGLRQEKAYLPVLAIGEQFGFYMNLDFPFYDEDFPNLRLDLAGDIYYQNIAPLSKDIVTAFSYNMYASGFLNGVAPGFYQFRIFNTVTGIVKCMSNFIYVTTAAKANEFSTVVKYRNSRDSYKFRFKANTLFYNIIRLNVGLKEWSPEGNIQQYRSVSSGRLRNEKYELDKALKLTTYYFDDAAHAAMTVLMTMDDIEINGRKYLAKSVYRPMIDEVKNVSKGEAEVFEAEFSKINKYG